MNRADTIASAEKHLRTCEQRVVRQQSLIDQLEKSGLETWKARELLLTMQQASDAARRALRLIRMGQK